MATNQLAVISPEGGLSRYLSEIRKFPMLSKDEEFMLAKRWQEHQDSEAAHKLVTSHLRLVAKIAMGYRGYGLPIGEVISEGNVGLMQAVKKFDPDKGFRLATYAMWWIRASIQEYILRSWSLVKMGTTAAQKKLFFNLRKAKNQMRAMEDGDLPPDKVKAIAKQLGVKAEDVVEMETRLSGQDVALEPVGDDDEENAYAPIAYLAAEEAEPGVLIEQEQTARHRSRGLEQALGMLDSRSRRIIEARWLNEQQPATLHELAGEFGVSAERIRQIENNTLSKMKGVIAAAA